MPVYEKHQPGEFCWVELATTDTAGAKTFYGGLFGWDAVDFPMGPTEVYTILRHSGKDAAAMYTMRPEQKAHGVPPHWGIYVAVPSANEAASKAKSLGGTLMMDAFDVADSGRMAVIQDPTGAVIQAWEAKNHNGTGIDGEIGTFCWAELATKDPAKAIAFYTALFGWTVKPSAGGGDAYTEVYVGARPVGGIMPLPPPMAGAPSHWGPYFRVADCDDIVNKAMKGGAQTFMPATDFPGIGRMAVLRDPQGAVFSIIKLF